MLSGPNDVRLISQKKILPTNRLKLIIRFGPRFFPVVDGYSPEMREVCEGVASELEETIQHGVYAMVGGPHFESPAEVKLLRSLGADVVGG